MTIPCKASWDRLLLALKPFRNAAGPEGEELRAALDGHFPGVDWDDDPQPAETTAEKHIVEKHIVEKHIVEKHIVEKHSGDHAFVVLDGQQWLHLVRLLEARASGAATVEQGLLQIVRDEARVPDGWRGEPASG